MSFKCPLDKEASCQEILWEVDLDVRCASDATDSAGLEPDGFVAKTPMNPNPRSPDARGETEVA